MSYSTSGPIETILRKEDTVDPVAGNDNTQGYAIKSRWINTSSNEEWVCTDASTGAALWELTTGGDGDVVGPASAVWHDVAKFNGTTGKLIETSTLNVNTAGQVLVQGTAASLDINERTTGPGLTAGRGKVWVRDDTPSALIFTNDAGTEHQLTQDLNGAGVPGAATGDGYPLGTTYADTTNDVGYILVDATVGVNVWWTGAAGGGGSHLGTWTYAGNLNANTAQDTFRTTGSLGSTVSVLQIDWLNDHNNNIQAMLERVAPGDVFYLRQVADTSKYTTLQVDSVDAQPDASDWQYQVTRIKGTTDALSGPYTVSIEWGHTGKLSGAGVPGAATGDGYPLGTTYADTTNDVGYILVDATVGVNVWWTATPTPTTLASNALVDIDATEVVIGGAYLDGSSGGTYSWEILGTYNDNGGGGNQDVIVTLYDRGPDGTPVAGVLRSTITITSLGTLDRVSQALTVAASPGTDTDEIDSDEPRLYEVRAKLDANGGVDTARILNVKFVES